MLLKSAQRCRQSGHCEKSGQIWCQNFPDMSLDQTVLEHEFKCVLLCLFVCVPLVLVTKIKHGGFSNNQLKNVPFCYNCERIQNYIWPYD